MKLITQDFEFELGTISIEAEVRHREEEREGNHPDSPKEMEDVFEVDIKKYLVDGIDILPYLIYSVPYSDFDNFRNNYVSKFTDYLHDNKEIYFEQ